MVLAGELIRDLNILEPFHKRSQFADLSYGCGPAGYDVRVEFDSNGQQEEMLLFPDDFKLASTIERFKMPKHVIGIVHDKSTWARRGLTVQNTVIEPGWEGWLTLELTNHSNESITLLRGMPIAQVLFHYVTGRVVQYDGKYHNQRRGPVEAR